MARTLKDIKSGGIHVRQTGVKDGMDENSVTEFYNVDPFCLVASDGTLVPSKKVSRVSYHRILVKGPLGEGPNVDFGFLFDSEVAKRGMEVPSRDHAYRGMYLCDGSKADGDKVAGRPATCLAGEKSAGELDRLASMGPSVVRLGDEHPWRRLLDTAVRDGRKVGFDIDVIRARGDDGFSVMTNSLIDFGGWRVVNRGYEPDLENILARGQLWPGNDAIMARGRQSQCHENSARYWARNMDRALLATGYALTDDDGMWRQHTWCVTVGEDGPRIVETTEPRIAYFGFVMTAEEAVRFHEDNVGRTVRLPKALKAPEPEEEPEVSGIRFG